MNIVEVVPKDNYVLCIKAEDGEVGFFDVKPYLESEVFAPLKNKDEFLRVRTGRYFIEWDCGADLSADTIQARWSAAEIGAQQSVPTDVAMNAFWRRSRP
ncbi:MAG: hypothetical protein JWQ90_4035 [Hydrocarboniphaga sp.]|uniref:DUF2442 domain-containing protein n=1 Tax=Hydrocarboniphaga sp. TaxID=2033016 RepID=UPI00263998BA|nr:DUF2442 domain-containing protein [Hydrocarboniphaga sp.]MDB5971585.1 hypothetical protein [Hydrocarboniphaga sp.]